MSTRKLSHEDAEAGGGETTEGLALERRLADKVRGAFNQAVDLARDLVAERLALCHQAIIEDDDRYPGVERRKQD